MSSPGIGDLADALAAGLEDPGPVPTSGPELVKFAGGRAELTRVLSGMNGPPRRADYADPAQYQAARTRWRTASRRAQRWDDEGKAGKQARGRSRPVALSEGQRERIREEAQDRRLLGLWKNGARVRLELLMRVPSPGPGKRQEPPRLRVLPAGGPGEWIPPGTLEPILATAAQGDDERAGMMLLEAFGEAYDFDLLETAEIEEVVRVKIWPEGTREPA